MLIDRARAIYQCEAGLCGGSIETPRCAARFHYYYCNVHARMQLYMLCAPGCSRAVCGPRDVVAALDRRVPARYLLCISYTVMSCLALPDSAAHSRNGRRRRAGSLRFMLTISRLMAGVSRKVVTSGKTQSSLTGLRMSPRWMRDLRIPTASTSQNVRMLPMMDCRARERQAMPEHTQVEQLKESGRGSWQGGERRWSMRYRRGRRLGAWRCWPRRGMQWRRLGEDSGRKEREWLRVLSYFAPAPPEQRLVELAHGAAALERTSALLLPQLLPRVSKQAETLPNVVCKSTVSWLFTPPQPASLLCLTQLASTALCFRLGRESTETSRKAIVDRRTVGVR